MSGPASTLPPAEGAARFRLAAWWPWGVAALILVIAAALRIFPHAGYKGPGFDENVYFYYAQLVDAEGLLALDRVAERYSQTLKQPETHVFLPPTRVGYYVPAVWWKQLFHGDTHHPGNLEEAAIRRQHPLMRSLVAISCLCSILLVGVAGAWAWRALGYKIGLGSMALVGVSPILIHLAQHAMIDVVFALWVTVSLWAIWELLKRPDAPGWLALLGFGLGMMVLTKESAMMAYLPMVGLVAAAPWLKWGQPSRTLWLVLLVAPGIALALLVSLLGGLQAFTEVLREYGEAGAKLPWVIQTGDGPWYRHLIEMLAFSPLVILLAVGGFWQISRQESVIRFALAFVALNYVLMCQIPLARYLRYTAIWEVPVRLLACWQLALLCPAATRWRQAIFPVALVLLCWFDVHQYQVLCVDFPMYELLPDLVLRALKILK